MQDVRVVRSGYLLPAFVITRLYKEKENTGDAGRRLRSLIMIFVARLRKY